MDEAGTVAAGTPTTLGPLVGSGGALAFADVEGQNLGYFTGAAPVEGGAEYDLYGFMALNRRHVRGLWAKPDVHGAFWGMKNPLWSTEQLDAQWQGYLHVLEDPDAGQVLNAQVNINPQGEVTGAGSIVGDLTGGNITIHEGTLSIVNAACGGLTGSFSGQQQGTPVTVEMSNAPTPETASMGVYHYVLAGKFSISTNGDSGYYFLFRNSRR